MVSKTEDFKMSRFMTLIWVLATVVVFAPRARADGQKVAEQDRKPGSAVPTAAESVADHPEETKSFLSNLVIRAQPLIGFSSPGSLNSETQTENSLLSSSGFKGLAFHSMSDYVSSNVYLGYQIGSMDIGLSYLFPLIKGQTTNGTDPAGGSATRVGSAAISTLSVRSYHTIARLGDMKFYATPSVGIASFHVAGTLNSSVITQSIDTSSTSPTVSGGLGAVYRLGALVSVYGEAGYLYAQSGGLNVNSQTNFGQTVGQTWKASDGSGNQVTVDAGGPYIAVGLTIGYSLF